MIDADDHLFDTDQFFGFGNTTIECYTTIELYYNRIDISEIIITKTNSKECAIYHYQYFKHGFKLQTSVCNGCHDLLALSLGFSDITIITVDRCIIDDISKSNTIHLLKNLVLDYRGFI